MIYDYVPGIAAIVLSAAGQAYIWWYKRKHWPRNGRTPAE